MLTKYFLLFSLVLSGCATTEYATKVVTQTVEVPVAIPCKVEIPDVPVFNFDKLKMTDDIFEKSKALVADRNLHLGYEEQLLSALKSCK